MTSKQALKGLLSKSKSKNKIELPTHRNIAYVLLSGGIDSTTCLHMAVMEYGARNVRAVSIDYGQRHIKEVSCAKLTCDLLSVDHKTLSLKDIVPKTMLTDKKSKVPNVSYDKIVGVSPTYVPFRNGLMLSALTSYIHGQLILEGLAGTNKTLNQHALYFGAHAEDAKNWAYPDCTPEFVGAMANAIFIGSYQQIRLVTPLLFDSKADVIRKGNKLFIDWKYTWSCYKGEKLHCGTCPTCLARIQAFSDAGVPDPTKYKAN